MAARRNTQVADQLLAVVRGLVDHPDQIELEEDDLGHTIVFRLSVAPGDLGKVIGRQGRTVRALRALLEMRATDSEVDYDVEVVDA